MEALITKLLEEKTKENLHAILIYMKTNPINNYITFYKDIFLMNNLEIDSQIQSDINHLYISELLTFDYDCDFLTIEKSFDKLSDHSKYPIKPITDTFITDYYNTYITKNKDAVYTQGQMVDFLYFDESNYACWTLAEISSVNNDSKEYVLSLPLLGLMMTQNWYSYRIQPVNTFTEEELQWRMDLKAGDIIDALDLLNNWLKATVLSREQDNIEVVFRIYHGEDPKNTIGYIEAFDYECSIFDARIRKKGTFSLDINYPNKYPTKPQGQKDALNVHSMHIPFNNKNYLIPNVNNHLIFPYPLKILHFGNLFIDKLIEKMDKEKENFAMSIHSARNIKLIIWFMSTFSDNYHPSFAKTFVPRLLSLLENSIDYYSQKNDKCFSKREDILFMTLAMKYIIMTNHYEWETNLVLSLLQLKFGFTLFKSSTTLSLQLLGLNTFEESLSKWSNESQSNEIIISKISSIEGNIFTLLFNPIYNHTAIISKTQDIFILLFKLKGVKQENLEEILDFLYTTPIKEFQQAIYSILSQSAKEMPWELLLFAYNKVLNRKTDEVKTNEDINLLIDLIKGAPDNKSYEITDALLNYLFNQIIDCNKNELIPQFCSLINCSDDKDNLTKLYFKYIEQLVIALSLQGLKDKMQFLSRLVQTIPLSIEKDIIYKVSYIVFRSPEELAQLIISFCQDISNADNMIILTYLYDVMNATKNSIILTIKDFMKSIFDIFSLDAGTSWAFFFNWLKELQNKTLLKMEQTDIIIELVGDLFKKQTDNKALCDEIIGFCWDLFLSINLLNKGSFKLNSRNPLEMKYFDIIWSSLINSKKQELIIDNFMDLFALPWLTQEERNVIWEIVIKRVFTDRTKDNTDNCLHILKNLVEVSDIYGTGNTKPHSSLLDSEELTIKIDNEINKNFDPKIELKIPADATLFDFKVMISEKLNASIFTFAPYRFAFSEISSLYNGRTMGSFFNNNASIMIKKFSHFPTDEKPIIRIVNNKPKLTPEVKEIFKKILNSISPNGKINAEQFFNMVSFTKEEHEFYIKTMSINTDCHVDHKLIIKSLAELDKKKIQTILEKFNYRDDLKLNTDNYEREPALNTKNYLMPRYILSHRPEYFNELFNMQADSCSDTSDHATNLINMIETNEVLYNEILDNQSSSYIANTKDNIYKLIYVLQIISSIIDKSKKEKESLWLKEFVKLSNDSISKSALEQIIDIFIEQMGVIGEDNKILLKLYEFELLLIKISLITLIDYTPLNDVLEHFDKVIEEPLRLIDNEKINNALNSMKEKLQLDKVVNVIIKNIPLLNNKEKNLLIKKEPLRYSFQILSLFIIGFGTEDFKQFIDMNLNDMIVNQLKIDFTFAQRFGSVAVKVIINQCKDNSLLKDFEELMKNELFKNNENLNKYSPTFIFSAYNHIIQLNNYDSETKVKIIRSVLDELIEDDNKFTDDILIGYYSILENIIKTMDSLFDITLEVLLVVIEKFLISDQEYDYSYCTERYLKEIYGLLTTLINKSKANLIAFYTNEKILDLMTHLTLLPDDKKDYNPKEECKGKQGFVGLKNLGAICYMNSILQQLFNVKLFKYCLREIPLCSEYDTPLYQLQKMYSFLELSNRRDYNPCEFVYSFKDFDGNPTDTQIQCDAQEFLSQFMDRIETALKSTNFKYLISNLFGGESCSQLFCTNPECDKISNRFEHLPYLSLEIKQMENIDECLKKYITEERIEGYYCEKCKEKVTHTKRLSINKLPNVLIIHLQRITFNYETYLMDKINTKLEYPKELNLKNYCTEQMQSSPIEDNDFNAHVYAHEDEYYQYKLSGVVNHTGTADYGHYFSMMNVKNMDEKESWMKMNDSIITDYSVSKLEEDTFGGSNSKEWGENIHQTAYLLFYQRTKKTLVPCLKSKVTDSELTEMTIMNCKDEIEVNKKSDIFCKENLKEGNTISDNTVICLTKGENQPKEYIELLNFDSICAFSETKEKEKFYFYNDIMKDNLKLTNDKKIFNKQFIEFIEASVKQINLIKCIEDNISEDIIIELYMRIYHYVTDLLYKTDFKENLNKVLPELSITLKSYPVLIPLLLKDIKHNQDKWVNSFLLIQNMLMGTSFASYLSNILIESIVSNTNKDLAYEIIDSFIEYFPVKLSRHWSCMIHFLEIFDNLTKSNNQEINEYLMEKEIITKLCDFFLGKQSFLYKNKDPRTEMGNSSVKPKFASLLSTIANLITYTPTIPLSQTDQKMLSKKVFYTIALHNEYDNRSLSKIMLYFMNNNWELTHNILAYMVSLVERAKTNSDIQTAYFLIKELLSLQDDYTQIRLENLIGIPKLVSSSTNLYVSIQYNPPMENNVVTIISKSLELFSASKEILPSVELFFDLITSIPHVFKYIKDLPHINNASKTNGLIRLFKESYLKVIESFNLRKDEKYTKKIETIDLLLGKVECNPEENYDDKKTEEKDSNEERVMVSQNETINRIAYNIINPDNIPLSNSILLLKGKYAIVEYDNKNQKATQEEIEKNRVDIHSSNYYLENLDDILSGKSIKRQLSFIGNDGNSYELIRYFILNTSKENTEDIKLSFIVSEESSLPKTQFEMKLKNESINDIIIVKKFTDIVSSINIELIKSTKRITSNILSVPIISLPEHEKINSVPILALPAPDPNDAMASNRMTCPSCGEITIIDDSNDILICLKCQSYLFS